MAASSRPSTTSTRQRGSQAPRNRALPNTHTDSPWSGSGNGNRYFRATPSEVARDRLRALASWKPEAIVAVGCAAALAFMLFGAVVAGGGR
jgi:hypothetical protein